MSSSSTELVGTLWTVQCGGSWGCVWSLCTVNQGQHLPSVPPHPGSGEKEKLPHRNLIFTSGSVTQIPVRDQHFSSQTPDVEILCCSFQLASPLSGSSGASSPPSCEGVNPHKSINLRTMTFGTEAARVKVNFTYCLYSHSLPNCASNLSPRSHSQSNKWPCIFILPQQPASNCFLQNMGTICTAMHKEPSTHSLFHCECLSYCTGVIKLKNRVGLSPMELALEFFTQRANIK